MITIKNLQKEYNRKIVLSIDHLIINRGEIFGLVGNNGAGKTTLLRLIIDLIKAERGSVCSNDFDVSKSEKWKDYTGSYLDSSFLIDFLTPEEFFYFIGRIYGYSKLDISNKLDQYKFFFNDEILKQENKLIRDFSIGNKQKIGVASSLLFEPRVIILDEPYSSLDPTSQFNLHQILKMLNEKYSSTIIISSHNINHISDLCTRIVLLEKGVIIKDFSNSYESINELEAYFKLQRDTTL